MKNIKIEVTPQELSLLITLMSDQLFRREFIDPKMPGYKGNPAELALGKDLVSRLRSSVKEAAGSPSVPISRRRAQSASTVPNGIPDGV